MRAVLAADVVKRQTTGAMQRGTLARRRYRWLLFVLVPAAGALAGYLWTLYQPKLYRAECILQYEREPAPPGASAPISTELSANEWYRTQDFLLASHSVRERVAQHLQLQLDRSFFGVSKGEPFAKTTTDAAALLGERLTIKRVEGTRLVRVAVDDTSPKRATRIADTVAQKYLEKALEDRVAASRRALTWLNEQMANTTRQLAQTETAMRTYLDQETTISVPLADRQQMLVDELKHLHQQLTDARVRRIELAATVAKLKSAERDNPFDIHTTEIDQNDQVQQLQAEYTAFSVKHHETEAGRGADNQVVQSGEVRLTALRKQMRDVIDGIQRSAQAELSAAQSVESQLQTLLNRTNEAGRELQRLQLEFGRLEREHTESRQLLKALRDRSAAGGLANALGDANAKVVETAAVKTVPSADATLRNTVLGAMSGFVLGFLSRRLRR